MNVWSFSFQICLSKVLYLRYFRYVDQNKVKDFPAMSDDPHPTFYIFATGFPLYCSFFF